MFTAIDRQVDFLLQQRDSAAFLIQVEPFLEALRSEPQLAAYLDDVLEEVVRIVDDMEAVDAELTAEPRADSSVRSGADRGPTPASASSRVSCNLSRRVLSVDRKRGRPGKASVSLWRRAGERIPLSSLNDRSGGQPAPWRLR